MHIKSLTLTNFQGRTTSHDLKSLTLITGDNCTGKTRLLNGIRVLLLGYNPALGKRPGENFTAGAADSMEVEGHFSDGRGVIRRYTMKRGTVSLDYKDPLVPPVLLDAGEYFSMSGPERTAYILTHFAGQTGVTGDSIRASLRTACGKVETPSPETEAETDKVLETVASIIRDAEQEDVSTEELLTAIVDSLKERIRIASATLAAQTGFQKTAVTLRSTDALSQVPANIEQLIEDARKERDKLVEGRAAVLNAGKPDAGAVQRNRARREAATRLAQLSDHSDIVTKCRAALDAARKAAEGRKLVDTDKAKQTLATGRQGKFTSGDRVYRLKRDISTIEGKVSAALKVECPCCGEKGKKCKATARVVKGLDTDKEKLEAELAAQEKAFHDYEVSEAGDLKALAAVEKTNAETVKLLGTVDQCVIDLNRAVESQNQYEAAAQRVKDLGEVEPEGEKPVDSARLLELSSAIEHADTTIGGYEAQQRQAVAQRQESLRQEQARQQMATVQAEVAVLKLATGEAVKLQQGFINAAFAQLLVTANKFTDGLLKAPLSYRDDLVMFADGCFVPHRTFSGTEKLLAYAGLAVALVQEAKVKVVLLDELDRCRSNRKLDIWRRMRQLIADGTINQCVCVSAEPGDLLADCGDAAIIEVK